MPAYGKRAIAGKERIAKAPPPGAIAREVCANPFERVVARQQRCEFRELIAIVIALQGGEIIRDLLQAEHVEIGNSPRGAHDAPEIHAPVEAAAPLNIPGDEPHSCNHPKRSIFLEDSPYT